jgi:hypothetical protein
VKVKSVYLKKSNFPPFVDSTAKRIIEMQFCSHVSTGENTIKLLDLGCIHDLDTCS